MASISTRPLPVALLVALALTGVCTPEQTLNYARRSRAAPDRPDTPGELAEIALFCRSRCAAKLPATRRRSHRSGHSDRRGRHHLALSEPR